MFLRSFAKLAARQPHRALNSKFKQCASAMEVEQLIIETPPEEFNDSACATAMRHLERRRSSNMEAIEKIVDISTSLPAMATFCLAEICCAVSAGQLLKQIPDPVVKRIEHANFHNVSPFHIAGMLGSFLALNQQCPQSISQTICNRTLFDDFTPRDLSMTLHAFATASAIPTCTNLIKHVLSPQCKLKEFSSKQFTQTWSALHKLGFPNEKFSRHFEHLPLADFNTGDLLQLVQLMTTENPSRINHELLTRKPYLECDNIVVSTFYKFFPVLDCSKFKRQLEQICHNHEIRGTILLASEGVNATICGKRDDIDTFYRTCGIPDLQVKESFTQLAPFHKFLVRIKPEVVAMGIPNVSVSKQTVGEYVKPQDWDAFVSQDDVVLIDTRNEYEIELGTFANAVNPEILRFKQFPQWFEENKVQFANKKVAMFCTGGVRCEKSTAYAKQILGDDKVYHLEGGILAYLQYKKDASSGKPEEEGKKWVGDCFVFDDRIAVDHDVQQSNAVPTNYKAEACREVTLKFSR